MRTSKTNKRGKTKQMRLRRRRASFSASGRFTKGLTNIRGKNQKGGEFKIQQEKTHTLRQTETNNREKIVWFIQNGPSLDRFLFRIGAEEIKIFFPFHSGIHVVFLLFVPLIFF